MQRFTRPHNQRWVLRSCMSSSAPALNSCTRYVDIQAPHRRLFHNVSSADQCARLCREDASCAVFLHNRYGRCHLRDVPWLRTPILAEQTEQHRTISCIVPARVPKRDALHLQDHHVRAALTLRAAFKQQRAALTLRRPPAVLRASEPAEPPPILFCWMLVRIDRESERSLLRSHLLNSLDSLGACDAHLILSNRSATLHGGRIRVVRGVSGPLEIPSSSGRWGTAVCPSCVAHFQQCWRVVARDERAKRASWVIKVDPDSVFFASRLRRLLLPLESFRRHADGETGDGETGELFTAAITGGEEQGSSGSSGGEQSSSGSDSSGSASGGLYLHNAIVNWGRNGSPMTVFWGPLHVCVLGIPTRRSVRQSLHPAHREGLQRESHVRLSS